MRTASKCHLPLLLDTIFKLGQKKPLAVKQAIAAQLMKQHKTSLAKAHLLDE
jgi:hypothetical protein